MCKVGSVRTHVGDQLIQLARGIESLQEPVIKADKSGRYHNVTGYMSATFQMVLLIGGNKRMHYYLLIAGDSCLEREFTITQLVVVVPKIK